MTTPLDFLTIAEAARHIRARDIAAVELVDHLFARIEALDPQIDTFITKTGELARRQAKEADAEIARGRWRGPMHGIPIGLKDIYSTAGILTSGHSRVGMRQPASQDATSVAKLYEAGAVLMGKLSTHEFAHGGPSFDLPWPPARNPWDPSRSAGGSSSGSAAAVAAGFVLGAMGSDTGGSVRVPAGRSGVAGLKPTYGLISRHGVINNSFSFDHCGPLTWTVEDCALMLQAVAGFDAKDPGSAERPVPDYSAAFVPDLKGWRIGVVRHFWEEDLPASDEERAAMDTALDVLRELGATLEDVRLRSLQEYFDVKIIVAESEIHSVHQRDLQERPGDFGADFMGKILLASLFSASDYVQAQRTRRHMLEEMEPIYARYDVLVTAGMSPAPRFSDVRIIDFWEKPNMTTPFSVTAGPALSLCNGYTQERVADVDAGRRPALRRDQDAAGGLRLRARHHVAAAAAEPGAGDGQGAGGPVDRQSDRSLALRREDAPARRVPARSPRPREGVGRAYRPAVRGGALRACDGGAGAPRPAAGGRARAQLPLSAVYRMALNLRIVRCTARRETAYLCTGRERERRSRDA